MQQRNNIREVPEDPDRMTTIRVFGNDLTVKNYDCAQNGGAYREKPRPIQLQLFILPTYYCPGNCPFCVAAETRRRKVSLDPEKLRRVLKELHQAEAVRAISITGGEPLYDIALLDEILEMIYEVCGRNTDVSINTGGINLLKLDRIHSLAYVNAIHISRHHYDDDKNRAYFGMQVPTGEEIAQIADIVHDPKLFVFNCLLFSDGIGTKEEMVKFLEFTGSVGVPKAAFVTPMPVNAYVKERLVSYDALSTKGDPRFLHTTGYHDYEYCHCQDGVYVTSTGKLVEWYGRETRYGCAEYARGLVYGADNVLRDGFGAEAKVLYVP